MYNPFSLVVSMPPGAYMLYNETEGFYQPKLFFDSIAGSVLGVNFMTGHHIVFDILSNRIGFSESDVCIKDPTNSSLPKPMGFFGQPGPDGKVIGDPSEVSIGGDVKEMKPDGFDGTGEADGIIPPKTPSYNGRGVDVSRSCGNGLYYSACCSATCRSFVAVCYATVLISLIAALVAMKSSKSRRSRTSLSAPPDRSTLSQVTSSSRRNDQYVSLTGFSSRSSSVLSPYPSQTQPYTDSYSGTSRRGGNFVV